MKAKSKHYILFSVTLLSLLPAGMVHAKIVGRWEFESSSCNDSVDNYQVRVHGSPAWIMGPLGDALQFNDLDTYVECMDKNVLIENELTITVWVKTVESGDSNFHPYIMGDTFGLRHYRTNHIEFLVYTDGTWHRVQFPVDSSFNQTWHFLAGTYDGKELRLYVDGKLEVISQCSGAISKTTNLNIGRHPTHTDRFYGGTMDDVRIYNHAVSSDDIADLYRHNTLLSAEQLRLAVQEVERILKEYEPETAADLIEKKIAEYELQTEKVNNANVQKVASSKLYLLLAKAKESAGASNEEVVAVYKQAITDLLVKHDCVPALLWLFDNISEEEFIDTIKVAIRNKDNSADNLRRIARDFESSDNWIVFEHFLDAVLSEVTDKTSFAKAISVGLKKNGLWKEKFWKYCQHKPELTIYVLSTYEQKAQEYIAQKDCARAIEIYKDIIKQCNTHQQRAAYELKLYEALFSDGQYRLVEQKLDEYIMNNKAKNRLLVIRAIILNGQTCIHLGKLDKAIDTFLTLMVEYPDAAQAPQATFFVGYCYMLQANFREASEAFELIVKDYANSNYIDQAKSYLERIESMVN